MKIAVVGPAYPLRGGIAQHVYSLREHLTARGHTLQVISYRRLYPQFLFPGRSTADTSNLKLKANALPMIDALNPATWIRAYRQIKGFEPNLIIFQWWNPVMGPVIGFLTNLLKHADLNCVIECHNVFPHESSPVDLPITWFAFSSVTNFIVHSSSDRDMFQRQFPEKAIWIAPLPPPAGLLNRSASLRDGRHILFFGLVRPYKGLAVLLEALPRVLARVDCKLSIVGEFYEGESEYRGLIERLGIAGHVEIDNRYVPNEEISSLFDRADVLVLPYLSATQSAVARLGLRSGLPIIASDTGGLSETVAHQHNGLLVPPGDPGKLADSIIAYFNSGLGPIFANNIRSGDAGDEDIGLIRIIEEMASQRG
ncbi:MAG: glycosyltransferase [Blastocatellia bacterium]